jgi:hypothetical protein
VDLPSWLPVPIPQALTVHVEMLRVRRIEYEHKNRDTFGIDMVRKLVGARVSSAMLFHIGQSAGHGRDGYEIVEFGNFGAPHPPRSIYAAVLDHLRCSETLQIVDKFFHALPGSRENVGQRTGRVGSNGGHPFVNVGWSPLVRDTSRFGRRCRAFSERSIHRCRYFIIVSCSPNTLLGPGFTLS